jgi:hypothetical protein
MADALAHRASSSMPGKHRLKVCQLNAKLCCRQRFGKRELVMKLSAERMCKSS